LKNQIKEDDLGDTFVEWKKMWRCTQFKFKFKQS